MPADTAVDTRRPAGAIPPSVPTCGITVVVTAGGGATTGDGAVGDVIDVAGGSSEANGAGSLGRPRADPDADPPSAPRKAGGPGAPTMFAARLAATITVAVARSRGTGIPDASRIGHRSRRCRVSTVVPP
jgi:hypothetical protein